MWLLVLGLVIFLGVHSVQIFAPDWRRKIIRLHGEGLWKLGYSLLSAIGLGLVIWGFSWMRREPVLLWTPSTSLKHLASVLMVISFILLAAAYVPRNQIKARLHHPMVLAVKVWAGAHLLANGLLAHGLLFGAFLVWAVLDFSSAQRRDRHTGLTYGRGSSLMTMLAVALGLLAWALFAGVLHGWLFGVRPLG